MFRQWTWLDLTGRVCIWLDKLNEYDLQRHELIHDSPISVDWQLLGRTMHGLVRGHTGICIEWVPRPLYSDGNRMSSVFASYYRRSPINHAVAPIYISFPAIASLEHSAKPRGIALRRCNQNVWDKAAIPWAARWVGEIPGEPWVVPSSSRTISSYGSHVRTLGIPCASPTLPTAFLYVRVTQFFHFGVTSAKKRRPNVVK